MGGSSVDDDWEFASEARTLVLFGSTGNGKSATGNSIIGKRVFESVGGFGGVTESCEMQTTEVNGQTINVIDTPGLFEPSYTSESIGKQIVKCIDFAKDGVHAILVVISLRQRFSEEEENALRSLQRLFGSKIVDYMIVVFTGGDELERDKKTLDDYLARRLPNGLKEILHLCGNRCVLFDNNTTDEKKRSGQVQQLLSLVGKIVLQNGGRPYTNELFTELKKGAMELDSQQKKFYSMEGFSDGQISEFKKHIEQAYEDQLKKITVMIESKLAKLEQQLAQEQAARQKSDEEIEKLRKHLEEAQEELRKRGRNCAIL